MVYDVVIALNSVGKRRVGDVILLLEKKGLEFHEIRRRIIHPSCREFPMTGHFVLQARLRELEDVMGFYREKFSSDVLSRKIEHFYGNHVELFFESGVKFIDPYELWKSISRNVFGDGRKLPIMFVSIGSEQNGIYEPFVPDFSNSLNLLL